MLSKGDIDDHFNGDRGEHSKETQEAGRIDVVATAINPILSRMTQLLQKTGHYERTCRGKRGSDRGRVRLNHDETEGHGQFTEHDVVSFQHDNSVGWVNNRPPRVHGWDSRITFTDELQGLRCQVN